MSSHFLPAHGNPDRAQTARRILEMVGPLGLEPRTKGFKFFAAFAAPWTMSPPVSCDVWVTGVGAVIKGAGPLR